MQLATVYTISLYGLTALASWMLARAEMEESTNATWWISITTWPVLAAAFLVTEGPRGWKLPAWLANLLGAVAVATAAWEFFSPDQQAKLLSGAHLLVYSTWIVMFQEKNIRSYWWVMALGVLQVAVASVLTSHEWYGVSLVTYLCGALWTMSVASLYQIQLQFGGEGVISSPRQGQGGELQGTSTFEQQKRFVQYDENHRWLTRRFVAGWSFLVAASLLVSAAFFAFTPRVWVGPKNLFGNESTPATERGSTTGFAKTIQLGEMGTILESVKPVMNVEIFDALTDKALPLDRFTSRLGMSELMLRGSILTTYSKGEWSLDHPDRPMRIQKNFPKPGFRVQVEIEALDRESLFSVGLPQAGGIGPRPDPVYLSHMTGLISRESPPEAPAPSTYSFYIDAPPRELAEIQGVALSTLMLRTNLSNGHVYECLVFPSRGLNRLRELAIQLVDSAEKRAGHPLPPYERAKLLEGYLRDSGEFGYTLDLTVQDHSIDPVEDFLFNRKEGHCEYFASTLVLMLRAVNIPARLVSGFKGAEPLSGGVRWQVQDRHAHAWVEAWTGNNLWVTLDPTPAMARLESVNEIAARVSFWERLQTRTSNLWSDYVVRVNLERQNQGIYGPLKEFGLKAWELLQNVAALGPMLWYRFWDLLRSPQEWFTLTGGFFVLALITLSAVFIRGLRWLYLWIRKRGWREWSARRWQQRTVVAFYEQFLRLAERAGLRRTAAQTPAEFAEEVQSRWQLLLQPAGMTTVPQAVCAAFYRVRYGGETLPEHDLLQLQKQVAQMADLVIPQRRQSS